MGSSIQGDLPITSAVIEALPAGHTITSAHHYGVSNYFVTGKIVTQDQQGNTVPFFIKFITGPQAADQSTAEFEGLSKLHSYAPDIVPKAYRPLRQDDNTYIFLMDFKSFGEALPEPHNFCSRIAALHQKSMSLDRRFGFDRPTYVGSMVQPVQWEESWTIFFTRLFSYIYECDVQKHGLWPELHTRFQQTINYLIPRLIGIMESDGKKLPSCLIHGDLWDANIRPDADTGNFWIFDCAVYYGHHEMDLSNWGANYHEISDPIYRDTYFEYIKPSEPQNEWKDRNLLYSLIAKLLRSINWPESTPRKMVYDDLGFLLEKYIGHQQPVQPESLKL